MLLVLRESLDPSRRFWWLWLLQVYFVAFSVFWILPRYRCAGPLFWRPRPQWCSPFFLWWCSKRIFPKCVARGMRDLANDWRLSTAWPPHSRRMVGKRRDRLRTRHAFHAAQQDGLHLQSRQRLRPRVPASTRHRQRRRRRRRLAPDDEFRIVELVSTDAFRDVTLRSNDLDHFTEIARFGNYWVGRRADAALDR